MNMEKNTEVQLKSKSQMHGTLNSLTFPHIYIYIYNITYHMLVNVLENTSFNSQAYLISKELKYRATIF
jgi:hypothetical protein